MPEAHPVEPLHELDRIARRPAPQAVKQPLRWRDDKRRCLVVVERAASRQVPRTVLAKLDPPAAHQRGQVGFFFDPLDLAFRYPGHINILFFMVGT